MNRASLFATTVALFGMTLGLRAQLVAGSVPVGYSMTTYSIHLEPLEDFTEAIAEFDVDCDGINDFQLLLDRNLPDIDFASHLFLISLVDSVNICADDMGSLCPAWNHAMLYSEGQPMPCTSPFALLPDTIVMVGDYVTFMCGGVAPQAADSAFIHYGKTSNGVQHQGWIQLSFNILSANAINPWADVYAATGWCSPTGLDHAEQEQAEFALYPNPSSGGRIKWTSAAPLQTIEVFDMLGQQVLNGLGGTSGVLDLSGKTGSFVVVGRSTNGSKRVERLVLN
jgi:hypothetical protein